MEVDELIRAFDATAHACNASVANASIAEGWYRVRVSKPGYDPVITYRYVREDEPVESFSAASCNQLSGATADTLSFTSFPNTTPGPTTPTPTPRLALPDVMIDPRELNNGRHPVCVAMPTPRPGEPWHNMTVIRFGTSAPNVGEGKLHVEEVNLNPNPGGTPSPAIFQRLYQFDKTPWVPGAPTPTPRESVMIPGQFTFHCAHSHVHLDNWTHMRIVRPTPSCGGDTLTRDPSCVVVGSGTKLSFCLEDFKGFDGGIKGSSGTGGPPFEFCGTRSQGINAGMADVYEHHLAGQFIEVTAVPASVYWLEAEVDPTPRLIEETRDNNVARTAIAIGGECGIVGGVWQCTTSTPGCVSRDCRPYPPNCCVHDDIYLDPESGLSAQFCAACKEYYCRLDPSSIACGGEESGCDRTPRPCE